MLHRCRLAKRPGQVQQSKRVFYKRTFNEKKNQFILKIDDFLKQKKNQHIFTHQASTFLSSRQRATEPIDGSEKPRGEELAPKERVALRPRAKQCPTGPLRLRVAKEWQLFDYARVVLNTDASAVELNSKRATASQRFSLPPSDFRAAATLRRNSSKRSLRDAKSIGKQTY